MKRSIECDCLHPHLIWDQDQVILMFQFLDQLPDFQVPPGVLSILFVDDATSGELHEQFFGDPDPTDVMTFPGSAEDEHAGDIAVSVDVADSVAASEGWTMAEELTLYLLHGWLHLAGLDDHEEKDIQAMRTAEASLMSAVRDAGLIPQFAWDSSHG